MIHQGKLYIVPTPIGNLKDITLRALEILQKVDIILAEDTRKAAVLLRHFQINTAVQSYHAHNEHKILKGLIEKLRQGRVMALISDAGTPAISDPGFLLSRACVNHKISVECLPGATAFVPALVQSGLPCDKFLFEGFLPVKKGRQTRLKFLATQKQTIVLYESPHRILKTLKSLIPIFGEDCKISISRELTKLYQENVRGTLQEALSHFEKNTVKGEFVLVIFPEH